MSNDNFFPFWNTDWVEAQRKYMEAWSALGGQATEQGQSAAGNGDANPWNKALEYWWQSVAQGAPGQTKDFYGKVVDQTQAFYFITDQLSRFMQGLAKAGENADNWQENLEQLFQEMKDNLSKSNSDTAQMFSGMFDALQLPMDTLQRTFSTASVFPGDFLQGLKPDAMEQATDKFLSVPGVGYSRESQEQLQEGFRLWARYQRTAHEYQVKINEIAVRALDILKQRIMDMAQSGEQVTTLRDIYDLWVDCNEAAYSEYVYTDEYSEIYGKLTNDLMALKRHGQGFMDESMSALGMPTRRSMSTMQKRQQQLRRDLIASKQRIENLEASLEKVETLEQEIRALKSDASGNKGNSPSAGGTNTSSNRTRPVASKKKTGKKKTGKKKTTSKKTG